MTKSLLIFFILFSCSFCLNDNKLFEEANNFYIKKNYKKSIELYEQIMGAPFEKASNENFDERMRHNLKTYF